jgi:hypothetical protein
MSTKIARTPKTCKKSINPQENVRKYSKKVQKSLKGPRGKTPRKNVGVPTSWEFAGTTKGPPEIYSSSRGLCREGQTPGFVRSLAFPAFLTKVFKNVFRVV